MSEAVRERAASPGAGRVPLVAAVAVALLVALLASLRGDGGAAGPVEPIWDRTPCAHCSMLVGDRAFAAQLRTDDGRALDFDDPGCLFEYERDHRPVTTARWFRHMREDRWVEGRAAGFTGAEATPMGFGLGAVDAGAPGAISLSAAQERVLARRGVGP